MVRVGRALWGSPSPPPCRSRVTQSRMPRTTSRRGLNISREGDSTASLGSLFQGSVTLRGKKFFLMISQPALVKSRDIVPASSAGRRQLCCPHLQPAGEGRQDLPLMAPVMDAHSPPFLPAGFAQGELEAFGSSSGCSAALEQWGHLKAAMMSLNMLKFYCTCTDKSVVEIAAPERLRSLHTCSGEHTGILHPGQGHQLQHE